ncbi:MAG: hypothetical protein LBH29_05885 [Elusimicrobiota bacterium]|jgi:ribosomal protein S25|nr:hypothetical protein [Elusimicrobiota bacterium]
MIGMENESALHLALKLFYSGEQGKTEQAVGGYICDAVRKDGVIVEVQTGNFKPIEKKLKTLCAERKVILVHPIIAVKTIKTYTKDGVLLNTRKSPIHEDVWDIFEALLYCPSLAVMPNLTFNLALVDIAQRRVRDGKGSRRRRGASAKDKMLSAFLGAVTLEGKKDFVKLIPFKKSDTWTAGDLAKKANIYSTLAGKAVYVLSRSGIIKQVGKRQRAYLYKIV